MFCRFVHIPLVVNETNIDRGRRVVKTDNLMPVLIDMYGWIGSHNEIRNFKMKICPKCRNQYKRKVGKAYFHPPYMINGLRYTDVCVDNIRSKKRKQ